MKIVFSCTQMLPDIFHAVETTTNNVQQIVVVGSRSQVQAYQTSTQCKLTLFEEAVLAVPSPKRLEEIVPRINAAKDTLVISYSR